MPARLVCGLGCVVLLFALAMMHSNSFSVPDAPSESVPDAIPESYPAGVSSYYPQASSQPAKSDGDKTATAQAVPQKEGGLYHAVVDVKGELLSRLKAVASTPNGNDGPLLILKIDGAVLPNTPVIEARVFIVKPDTPIPTATDHPGFVGRFSLGNADYADKPRSHVFELNPILQSLARTKWFRPDQPLQVFVVGVDTSGAVIPVKFRGAKLSIDE